MPYASIIIPTHDRASTLAAAVRSAQGQTVPEIEILIVGDGCTPQVREIASGIATTDNRVRFLDWPKEPLRGVANRDRAVRCAAAERIFYSDDDDLLLPHHVETLGAELEHVDLVDTPCASYGVEGQISLGILNSGNGMQRQMLIDGNYRAVFDTHLAHRRSAYTDRAPAWLNASDRRVVLHMMRAFAVDMNLRWKTLQRTTALSLHGARRIGMGEEARRKEIEALSHRLSISFESEIRATGGYCAHAWHLLQALHDITIPDAGTLFGMLDIDLHSVRDGMPNRAALALSNNPVSALNALLAARAGKPPGPAAESAINELVDPLLGPYFAPGTSVRDFVKVLGRDAVRELMASLPERPATRLGVLELSLQDGDVSQIDETARIMLHDVPDHVRLFCGAGFASALIAYGHVQRAWAWLHELAPATPVSFKLTRFWQLYHAAATKLGRENEVVLAQEKLAALEVLND